MANAWECPRCHVINAPHMDRCTCPCGCKPEDGGVKKDFMPKYPGQSQCLICGEWGGHNNLPCPKMSVTWNQPENETGKPLAHRVHRQTHYVDSELNRVPPRNMFHGDGE